METRHKILLLDDDPDLLDIHREILGQLPSRPEIRTATTGGRAMAMLETEPFTLLICDLKMPKMDGLQKYRERMCCCRQPGIGYTYCMI